MASFDKQYKKILSKIKNEGVEELNQRTGHKTKSLPGINIEIENEFPLLALRRIPIRVFVAEQIWFISGSRRVDDFLNKHAHIWDAFVNPGGTVTAAYGFRWRAHFGRDQLGKLIELLEKDPSSRHGVVCAWDPGSDGLEVKQIRKNVPCPFIFVVNIMNGKLNMHSIVRSNDMILGCPHDVAGFALLQRFLAARIDVGIGKFTQSISHAHVYDIHYHAMDEIIKRRDLQKPVSLKLKYGDFARAEAQSDELVEEIVAALEKQYNPRGPIKDIPIVL